MKTNKFVEEFKIRSSQTEYAAVAAKKELFNLRFQNATNQLDNIPNQKVRKNIARIQTVITEKSKISIIERRT